MILNKNLRVILARGFKYNIRKVSDTKQKYNLISIKEENEKIAGKPFASIPGPNGAPLFGNFWHFLPGVGQYSKLKIHELHFTLQKEYGNIVRFDNLKYTNDMVFCYDPKDIETVLRNEGPWPRRDILLSLTYYRNTFKKDLFKGYPGLFSVDDKEWQEARSVMNTLLMQPRTVKQYVKNFNIVVDDFVKRMRYLENQHPLGEMPEDFSTELQKCILELVGVLGIDTRFGFLENNLSPYSKEIKFIQNVKKLFECMYEIDVKPSLSKYTKHTPTWRKFINTLDEITEFINNHINETKTRLEKQNVKKDINEMSIIEKLINLYEPKYLFGNIMDIFLAGEETTTKTISTILLYLAKNKDVQDKLRMEVMTVCPEKNTIITLQDLEKMQYLKAVINESMRLVPVTIGLSRKLSTDIVLSGYHIPKGTTILLEQLPLLWSENVFSDAKKFQPERWLRNRNEKKEIKINPWVYLPFGFGPRACVGKRFANLEMELVTAKIVRNFYLEWYHGDIQYETKVSFKIKNPIQLRVKSIQF